MAATRIIKKYPTRRLYDTEISSYITIEDVRQLILDGEDFEVRDAKSGDDLTRSVLLQIIADQEQDGEPMLSTQLLSQLIRFYGDSTWSAACRSSSTSSSSSASRWATCSGRRRGR
jgi:polyhydroxyalkanoate synthesis repressor PhaR